MMGFLMTFLYMYISTDSNKWESELDGSQKEVERACEVAQW